MSRTQVWPQGGAEAEPPEMSQSALADTVAYVATRTETDASGGDAASDSDTERGLEEGANAPLLPTETNKKKKKKPQKRVLVRGDRGQVMMRCGSIDDSLETSRKGLRRLLFASVLCLIFMVVEIIGGKLANSIAVMSDAAHMASDLAGFLVSIAAILLARRSATARLTFGFQRAEVIGAVASVLLMWGLTGFLLAEAVERVKWYTDPAYDGEGVDGKIMTIIAIVGLVVNVFLAAVLMAGGHGHSHGGMSSGHGHAHGQDEHEEDEDGDEEAGAPGSCSTDHSIQGPSHANGHGHGHGNGHVHHHHPSHGHSHAHAHGGGASQRRWWWPWGRGKGAARSRPQNINVRAAFIHVIGDSVQGVGMLLAGILIWANGNDRAWWIADPICTFIFALLVVVTTITILRDAVHVLMEGAPTHVNVQEMETMLRGIRGVVSVHNLHVWSITPGRGVVVVHLAVPGGLTFAQVARVLEEAEEAICGGYDIHHVTIQVEPDLGNLHCQYSNPTAAAITEAGAPSTAGSHVDVSAGPVAL